MPVGGGDGIGIELTGLDELLTALDDLGSIGKRAVLQDAMKKGAEVVAQKARELAPRAGDIGPRTKYRPHLADSIKVLASLSKAQMRKRGGRRAEAEVFVGSTRPHAHLVEFGHLLVKGKTRKGKITKWVRVRRTDGTQRFVKHIIEREAGTVGRVIGHVPAHPFMRTAFDATRQRATQVVFQEMGRSLTKVIKRYSRQAERVAAGKGKLSRGARQAFRVELGL